METIHEHIDQQLASIRAKQLRLQQQYMRLQKEHKQLEAELMHWKQTARQQILQIQQLQLKVDALKTASSLLGKDEKQELEKKIDSYLREIDKCLTLLSA